MGFGGIATGFILQQYRYGLLFPVFFDGDIQAALKRDGGYLRKKICRCHNDGIRLFKEQGNRLPVFGVLAVLRLPYDAVNGKERIVVAEEFLSK